MGTLNATYKTWSANIAGHVYSKSTASFSPMKRTACRPKSDRQRKAQLQKLAMTHKVLDVTERTERGLLRHAKTPVKAPVLASPASETHTHTLCRKGETLQQVKASRGRKKPNVICVERGHAELPGLSAILTGTESSHSRGCWE